MSLMQVISNYRAPGASVPPPPLSGNYRIQIEGQSNATGLAYVADLPGGYPYTSEFDRVYIYNPGTSAYVKLNVPENNLGNTDWDAFGPELAIAKAWMDNTSSGNLYIDKKTSSGHEIADFTKPSAGYTDTLNIHTGANAWFVANAITIPENKGWVWVQGESDYLNTEAYYKSQLDGLVADKRTDGLLETDTKLIIVTICNTSGMYGAGVRAAQLDFVSENPTSVILNTDSYSFNSGDGVHYNAASQLAMGLSAFGLIF